MPIRPQCITTPPQLVHVPTSAMTHTLLLARTSASWDRHNAPPSATPVYYDTSSHLRFRSSRDPHSPPCALAGGIGLGWLPPSPRGQVAYGAPRPSYTPSLRRPMCGAAGHRCSPSPHLAFSYTPFLPHAIMLLDPHLPSSMSSRSLLASSSFYYARRLGGGGGGRVVLLSTWSGRIG
jgi:hypothetical protein